ncbi:hypothetical protein [Pedobacter agri]|uniref:Uncharacterized protein n=1 Tax=Pedobacter agri TaxID=454586 RepID=A0A9X3I9B2_9SPHI|nr:hypothetical protein [Pedobacter agri]MCX3265631.1 hypothetical protein [Pedobacter agri]
MLRKHILSLAALVFGFGLFITQSAFTPSNAMNEKRAKLTFHYDGPQPMTRADVETESNWVYGEESCPEGNYAACAIQIESTFVDNPSSANPTLKTSANITAGPNPSDVYVSGSADNTNVILNRAE